MRHEGDGARSGARAAAARGASGSRARSRTGPAARARVRRLPDRPAHRRRRALTIRSCRSSPVTRSSARCSAAARASRPAHASACRGSAGPTAPAGSASPARRTSATPPASRGTTSTAATPSSRSPTSASASRSRRGIRTSRRRRSCARASSGTARSGSPGTRRRSASTASARRRTSSARSRSRRAAASSPAPAPVTRRRRSSRARSARSGRATRSRGRPRSSTRSSCSHPSASSFQRRCGHVRKGGSVVCAGIHMSDIPSFPYELLWGERVVRSVANLTRADGEEFLALAPTIPVRTEVETFRLEEANEALDRLRDGALAAPPCSSSRCLVPMSAARSAPSRRGRPRPRGRPGASCARCRTRRGGAARARDDGRGSPRRGRTRTCADSAGNPDVIVQTWRSCTSTTPGAEASRRPSASASMPRGVDSSRIAVESRRIVHALASTRTPIRMLTSGSASTQPVVRITTAATATPTEPRRSAKTWRNAASTLRLSLARAREDDARGDVHDEADECDDEHPAAEHVAGIAKAHDRLDEDPDRERDEQDAVRERRQHLGALVAERSLGRRRLRGEPGRHESERERDVVGEHVHRVGEEREAARRPRRRRPRRPCRTP